MIFQVSSFTSDTYHCPCATSNCQDRKALQSFHRTSQVLAPMSMLSVGKGFLGKGIGNKCGEGLSKQGHVSSMQVWGKNAQAENTMFTTNFSLLPPQMKQDVDEEKKVDPQIKMALKKGPSRPNSPPSRSTKFPWYVNRNVEQFRRHILAECQNFQCFILRAFNCEKKYIWKRNL